MRKKLTQTLLAAFCAILLAAWFSAAKTALDVDDATAEELLARCVKEGY